MSTTSGFVIRMNGGQLRNNKMDQTDRLKSKNLNSLYEILDQTERIEDRKKVISDYLGSQDITPILPERGSLFEETGVFSKDDKIDFPFVVGNKYLRDEPSGRDDSFVYVLGIVRTPASIRLLVVEPDQDTVGCLPLSWMGSPEARSQ